MSAALSSLALARIRDRRLYQVDFDNFDYCQAEWQDSRRYVDYAKLIDGAIGELLVLLSQKASHDVLTEKVEALRGPIQSLFPKPSSKASQPGPA